MKNIQIKYTISRSHISKISETKFCSTLIPAFPYNSKVRNVHKSNYANISKTKPTWVNLKLDSESVQKRHKRHLISVT